MPQQLASLQVRSDSSACAHQIASADEAKEMFESQKQVVQVKEQQVRERAQGCKNGALVCGDGFAYQEDSVIVGTARLELIVWVKRETQPDAEAQEEELGKPQHKFKHRDQVYGSWRKCFLPTAGTLSRQLWRWRMLLVLKTLLRKHIDNSRHNANDDSAYTQSAD